MDKTDQYAFFLENSFQIYLLTKPSGEILECNNKACQVFGYTEEDITRLSRNKLILNNEQLKLYLEKLNQTGEASGCITGIKSNAEHFTLQVRSKVFYDELSKQNIIVIMGQEINNPLPYLEEINTNRQKDIYKLFEEIQIGVVVYNEQDEIIQYNKKVKELLGVSDSFIGKTAAETNWILLKENLTPYSYEEIPSTIARKTRKKIEGVIIGVKHRIYEDLVWLKVDAQPTFNNTGEPIVIVSFSDITDQIKLKDKLEKTTLFLEQTNTEARIGGWEFDLTTKKIVWSKITKEIHEVDEDFEPAIDTAINFYTDGTSRDTITAVLEKLIIEDIPYSIDLQIKTAKGNNLWVHTTGKGERKNGKCIRIYGSFQDIQNRKLKELEEHRRKQEFKTLFDGHPDAAYSLDVNGNFISYNNNLLRLLDCTEEELSANRSFIPFCPKDDLEIVLTYFEKVKEGQPQSYESRAITPKGEVKDVLVTNIPIIVENNLTGIFGLAKDITKEKSIVKALEQSEEYLRAIFDYSLTAILVADDQGNYLDVNQYACELFGYTREEMLNMNVSDIKMVSKDSTVNLYRNYVSKGIDKGEFHFYTKQGKEVSSLYNAIRIRENFNVSIIIDITERIEYESKLTQSESRIKTILESEPECIKIVDASGRILEMNPAGLNMIEASSVNEIQGKYVFDIVHTEDREKYKLQHQKALSGENSMARFRIIGLKGTLRWLESNSVGFKENATQKTSVLSVSRDITKQVEADEKLKASQQMLEQIFNTVSDVIYVLDIEPEFKLKYITINHAFTKYTGLGVHERIGKYVEEVIDQSALKLEIKKYKEAVTKKTTVTWRQTFHYPKGTRTAILSATPLFDANNECTRLICSARDITDIIDSQNEIRKLSLIARETINGAVITDIEGKILWVNRAFEKISGYKLNELTGKKPGKLLQGKDTDPSMLKLMSESIRNKQPFDVEIVNYTKSGTPYWIRIQCQPLVNSHDKVEGFFAIETDITHEVETKNEREFLIMELTENNNDLKQFTYITSHNLRSPLTNLVAIANLLEVPEDMDELNKKLIEGFKISTYQLNETLDSLIKILLLKENTQISQQKIKFNDILNKILGSLSILIKENQVIIDTDFSEVDTVHFSPSYMESIFLNLITNSIKYRASDRHPHIQIKSYIRPDYIMVKYTDNGSGFDADRVRNRVFGLFQRFHPNKDGKGIGLYLIKSQLSSLGGNIQVESEENKGTTFTLTFKRND